MKLWSFKNNTCRNPRLFPHVLFLDDHNFIKNHPPDLKLVSNDAPCDMLQSVLKIRL
jgi:hypothetical protein